MSRTPWKSNKFPKMIQQQQTFEFWRKPRCRILKLRENNASKQTNEEKKIHQKVPTEHIIESQNYQDHSSTHRISNKNINNNDSHDVWICQWTNLMFRFKSTVIRIINDRQHRKNECVRSAHDSRKPRTKPCLEQCVDTRHKQQCLDHTSFVTLQKK